jgi:demethylmenaquinone methyltransferase/2-methoxy-6-polyprenyl-1,4-benzoquinol methylase
MGILQQRHAARRWYRFVSPLYDPLVGETFWPERRQREMLADLPLSEAHVLDVGCGTGATADLLAARAARVDALDHSRPQLQQAREAVPAPRYVRGDAERLPYRGETFDVVVSIGAVIFFPNPQEALAEAHRVTRPGGHVLVAGFNRPNGPSLTPIEGWARLANSAFYYTADRAEALRSFAEAGWENIETSVTGPAWHPRLIRVTTGQKAETA